MTLGHRIDRDVTMPLKVNNPNRRPVTVPASITVPANQLSASVTVTTTDTRDKDGDHKLTFFIYRDRDDPFLFASNNVAVTVRDVTPAGTPTIKAVTNSVDESGDPNRNRKLNFGVILSKPVNTTVKVDYRTGDGSARAGSDYIAKSGTLVFRPNEVRKDITVEILEDGVGEDRETFRLWLSNPTGVAVLTQFYWALGIIYDRNPTFIVYDASAHESGSGTDSTMSFKVHLLNADGNATVRVDYTTADGSARAPSDYTATSGTLTFRPGGPSSQIVTVPVKDDAVEDSGETFSLRLSNPQGGAQLHVSRSRATGTILAALQLSISDAAATEGVDETIDFVVGLSQKAIGTVTVDYATSDDTATAGTNHDYTATSGTLTFLAGEKEKTISVPVLDDAEADEADERFFMVLDSLEGAKFANPNQDGDGEGVGTIRNNAVPLELSISDATGTEGADETMDFVVSLNRATTRSVTVDVLFSSGTADFSDIELLQDSVTFEPGETEKTYSIGIVDDNVDEPSETFSMILIAGVPPTVIALADSVGEGTILAPGQAVTSAALASDPNDDGRDGDDGVYAIGDVIRATVTFSGPVTVDESGGTPFLVLEVGSGTAEARYESGSGTGSLVFAYTVVENDEDSDGVAIAANGIKPDGGVIRDASEAKAALTHGATPADAGHRVDGVRPVLLSAMRPTGGDTFILTFSETISSVFLGSFALATATGSPLGSPVDPVISGAAVELTPPGFLDINLVGSIQIGQAGVRDLAGNGNATRSSFAVSASSLPQLSVADAEGTEGTDAAIDFTVRLSAAQTGTVTIDYNTQDGTATAGSDYTETSGTLTFNAGETEKTVSVPIIDDTVPDDGETFILVLTNPAGATLGDAMATGTIRNTEEEEPTTPANTLTASFPESPYASRLHKGASDRPQVVVAFSEAVESFGKDTQSVLVTGGTVASVQAHTEDGLSNAWIFFVTPEGDGDVTFALAAGVACAAGGICTAGGTTLTDVPATRTIPGPDPAADADDTEEAAPPPLTASFEGVPASHGGPGSEAFTFRVRFNIEPRVSYTVLRDESFAVTGGDVDKARRVDGRNDLREIHIEPLGWDDVTVMLAGGRACGTTGAICTADGRVLSGTLSVTVPGPVSVSVADARAEEGPNAELLFPITLSRAASGTVTVGYATSDGTATAGADYTATSGTLTFLAGETEKTVSVPVLDDILDDGGETLKLTLSDPTGARIRDAEALGTIGNSDPLPKAWLARFGRTVANHVVEAVRGRMSSAQGPSRRVTLGGADLKEPPDPEITQPSPWDELTPEDQRPESFSSLRVREFLLSSSFEVPLAQNATRDPGPGWTAWGGAARTSFSGSDSEVSIDGDVTTATLGVDRAWDRVLLGLALARSTGDGSYGRGDIRGDLKSSITSAHPYLRFSLNDRLSAWTLLGYGRGELTLTHSGGEEKTDIEMKMAALGARGALFAAGGFDISARTDALLVRTSSEGTSEMAETEADVSRLWLVLEGSRPLAFASGSSLTPSVELGVRRDGGDAERGVGFEVGGGMRYANPSIGLTVEITARRLMAHEQDGYSEWGAGGSVQFAPGGSDRGFSAKLGSSVGTATSGVEGLWAMGDARGLTGGTQAPGRLDAEAGYAMGAFGGSGVITPYGGFSMSGDRRYRAGWRLGLGDSFNLSLEGDRTENPDAPSRHGVALRGSLRW